MNHPEPLTPEERELARLLGRPGNSAPSARVDDAVLAAARTAVGAAAPVAAAPLAAEPEVAPARVRRPRARLPAVLGVAASVVFAVGLAWQLKFDDPASSSAPPPAVEVAAPAADTTAAPADSAMQSTAAPPPPAPEAVPSAATEAATAARRAESVASPKTQPIAPPPAAPAPAVMAAPAPMVAPVEVEADGAAAPAAAAPEQRQELDRISVTGSKIDTEREPSALRRQRAVSTLAARAEPAAADAARSAKTDPIATAVEADALLPRRRWIQRIRERRDAGDVDTARASLERYLQQYPEVRIPRDLRALLDS